MDGCLLFFHGLTSDPEACEPVADYVMKRCPSIKWILPRAKVHPVLLLGGEGVPAWFDFKGLGIKDLMEDEQGIKEAIARVHEMLREQEEKGTGPILVGGFSQGGMLALAAGLTYPGRLDGIIALSTYLPLQQKEGALVFRSNQEVPIFYAHGTTDTVLKWEWAKDSVKYMRSNGFQNIDTHWIEGMNHTTTMDELNMLADFLTKI